MDVLTKAHLFFERPQRSTPERNDEESLWWEKFSEIEEKFCWAQTPSVRSILRRDYVHEILSQVPAGGSMIELGCGTGWLCCDFAQAGAARVVGLDASAKQVEIARKRMAGKKFEGRVQFNLWNDENFRRLAGEKFDAVIFHAFLHHLTGEEIERMLGEARRLLRPEGKLIVVEPIQYSKARVNGEAARRIDVLHQVTTGLCGPEGWARIEKCSEEESLVRTLIEQRAVGKPPFGVSPKELPFSEGEMEAILEDDFEILSQRPCLAFSHFVAQEILLMGLSRPLFSRMIQRPLLMLAKRFERQILTQDPRLSEFWVFQMWICRRKDLPASKNLEEKNV